MYLLKYLFQIIFNPKKLRNAALNNIIVFITILN